MKLFLIVLAAVFSVSNVSFAKVFENKEFQVEFPDDWEFKDFPEGVRGHSKSNASIHVEIMQEDPDADTIKKLISHFDKEMLRLGSYSALKTIFSKKFENFHAARMDLATIDGEQSIHGTWEAQYKSKSHKKFFFSVFVVPSPSNNKSYYVACYYDKDEPEVKEVVDKVISSFHFKRAKV